MNAIFYFIETFWNLFGGIIQVILLVVAAVIGTVLLVQFPLIVTLILITAAIIYAMYVTVRTWPERKEQEAETLNRYLNVELRTGKWYK